MHYFCYQIAKQIGKLGYAALNRPNQSTSQKRCERRGLHYACYRGRRITGFAMRKKNLERLVPERERQRAVGLLKNYRKAGAKSTLKPLRLVVCFP